MHRQIVGALFVIGWNLVWTSLIMLFIKHVLRIPLRMSEEQLAIGDEAIHGVSLSLLMSVCFSLTKICDLHRKWHTPLTLTWSLVSRGLGPMVMRGVQTRIVKRNLEVA